MSALETWLVIGASSAIAREFARAVARDGADVLLAGRDRADLETAAADLKVRSSVRAEAVDCDVLKFDQHARVLDRAFSFAASGTLNLFFAVGTMPPQEALDADPVLARGVIDTNYTAAVEFLQVAAPLFEARKVGRIVVLGSVAGDRGRPSNYIYGSTKAALHTYLQGLRARLFHAGVSVTTVKPGPVDTAMTFGLGKLPLLAAPADIAALCLKAARRGADEVYTPGLWRWIMAVVCAVPERIFKRMKI
jgi:decaprenylphospho-beta-D-erythro-pentofuranosid-2-ulose 2-reductase